jgi:glycosyltransferase involved in cell wall biosynthesis
MKRISEYDVRDQIVFIGLIPHDHLYSLIRQSKCVLNPSLFEGWSTTVEESKSVGKRMILSDLDVHKEQDPRETLYFSQTNAIDLAEKIKYAWLNFESGPDLQLESKARQILPDRMTFFAETFISICKEGVQMIKH